jgi:alcohol dehydrogenase class IV
MNIARRIFHRAFNSVMYLLIPLFPYREPKLLHEIGGVADLLRERGIARVMIVTDRGIRGLGLTLPLERIIKEGGIALTVYDGTMPNPTSDNVEEAREMYVNNGCQALIAFGGGSAMDCAKAVGARVAYPNRAVGKMAGVLRVLRPLPTLIAIPTTAGTGSETTLAAVITDSREHHKYALMSFPLIPHYAVLDATLTYTLPPHLTSTTGMDALAHAVEAYTNKTYNTKLENRLAKEAVKLIHDNILIAFEDGSNLEARQNMQRGAFYAGRAFTRGCVGYVHAIGHTLGGLYGVAHGLAMAVLLPHVMREFGASAHKRLAELADVCGIEGRNEAEKANAFINWIDETNKKMGLPDGFDMIRDEDIEQMITWAKKEANPLYPVPVVWARKDFRRVIEAVRK